MRIISRTTHSARRWRRAVIAAALLGTAVPAAIGWRVEAQRPTAPQPASQPVLRLARGQSIGTAADKGRTYNDLASAVTLVRTVFDDGIAVAERGQNGDIHVAMSDRTGRQVATMTYQKATGVPDQIELEVTGGRYLRMPAKAGVTATLDWANRQMIAFWKDRDASGIGTSVWLQNIIRPIAAPPRDYDAAITEVETRWADGIVARAAVGRPVVTPKNPKGSRRIAAILSRGTTRLGWAQYFVDDRVLNFSFPGSTPDGYIDDRALAEYGGWTFVPDLAWLNMQAYAYHELPRRTNAERRSALPSASPAVGALARLINFFAPAVQAQDGCTGLHWLDYTIYRQCCDRHDLCFSRYGCDRFSWRWPYSYAWGCTGCNATVVFCFFLSGGGVRPYYPTVD